MSDIVGICVVVQLGVIAFLLGEIASKMPN